MMLVWCLNLFMKYFCKNVFWNTKRSNRFDDENERDSEILSIITMELIFKPELNLHLSMASLVNFTNLSYFLGELNQKQQSEECTEQNVGVMAAAEGIYYYKLQGTLGIGEEE